jgi:hypothetical protein
MALWQLPDLRSSANRLHESVIVSAATANGWAWRPRCSSTITIDDEDEDAGDAGDVNDAGDVSDEDVHSIIWVLARST